MEHYNIDKIFEGKIVNNVEVFSCGNDTLSYVMIIFNKGNLFREGNTEILNSVCTLVCIVWNIFSFSFYVCINRAGERGNWKSTLGNLFVIFVLFFLAFVVGHITSIMGRERDSELWNKQKKAWNYSR